MKKVQNTFSMLVFLLFLWAGFVEATSIGGAGNQNEWVIPDLRIGVSGTDYTFPSTRGTENQILKLDASGNLTFQADAGGGSDEKVGVDALATPDYLGASGSTGALQIDATGLTYTDGGNYVTLGCDVADTDTTGCLSDTDWDTFNGKQDALVAGTDYAIPGANNDITSMTALTGDIGSPSSITFATGGAIRTGTVATNTLLGQAYDTDGASYTTFFTATAADTPTFDLASFTTIGGSTIGTVTSVAAGNGLDFTTITGSGSVTLGTPSSLTPATSNGVTSTSHTHEVTGFLVTDGLHTQTPSSDTAVVAGTALTVTKGIMRIVGSGGPVTVTATPSIADLADGTCFILQGTDDTNTVKFQSEGQLVGSGLTLSNDQDFTLGKGDMIILCRDDGEDTLYEISRSDN
jgi:hypothetical protein